MINKSILSLLLFITFGAVINAQKSLNSNKVSGIEYIDIIHCTHTDYGYTDHPYIVEDIQQKFLNMAVDAASETCNLPADERFCWTAEALDVVWKWWQNATPDRRSEIKKLIQDGQIDVSALPYNIHPFLNARQWDLAFNWIPEELWHELEPRVGIQHDVNGFPRVAAIKLLDKGVKYIWNGINTYWGGAPFLQPSGFWWRMSDGRKILVWQSFPYWYGYNLFTEKDWRYVQSTVSNTQFRTPRIGDILSADEASVRKAHAICLEKIKGMKEGGYNYDFITVSITNQWRIDNDGPFPRIVDFIKKWNELKLVPELRLTTASEAMARIEKRLGKSLPVYEGEWPDWWAFGGAASPRELAASRYAGYYAKAALSPVWGGNSEDVLNKVNEIDRSLCRFYEHTFATNQATTNPYGLFNQGHLAEKSIYAYRPYEQAKWLAAQRMRKMFTNQQEGLYVVNTGNVDYTGWIELDRISFREVDYKSVKEAGSGQSHYLYIQPNNRIVKFWVNKLKPNSYKQFLLSEDSVLAENNLPAPEIKEDQHGWPQFIRWKGMVQPLFAGEIGKFFSLESTVGRNIEFEIWNERDSLKRAERVTHSTKQIFSTINGNAQKTETPFSIVYTQKFYHTRLEQGERILEVWKNEPRVSVDIRFYRLPSSNPEIFYVEFPLPDEDAYPVASNGGEKFLPYLDQIPGTCTDFFTIDGWVNYPAQTGDWLWSSRDAALVSFSGPQLASKRLSPPENMNKILAMIYNNMWEVNFLHDCPGNMQFHFDLIWNDKQIIPEEASKITQTYNLPPLVMLNPETREDNITFKWLNKIE